MHSYGPGLEERGQCQLNDALAVLTVPPPSADETRGAGGRRGEETNEWLRSKREREMFAKQTSCDIRLVTFGLVLKTPSPQVSALPLAAANYTDTDTSTRAMRVVIAVIAVAHLYVHRNVRLES